MNNKDKTTPSSHQLKSFMIKDILEFANGNITKDEDDKFNSQLKKENIQDWNILKKRKQGAGKQSK